MVAAASLVGGPSWAGLTLTPAAASMGFTLTNYLTGYNWPGIAVAPLSDGNMVAADYGIGALVKYADVDGQVQGVNLGSVSLPGLNTVASVGGHTYAGLLNSGIVEVSPTLATTSVGWALPFGVVHTWGLWGNQVTGHLLASTSDGIYDIDPILGVVKKVTPGVPFIDGVSTSPDGTIVYVSSAGKSRVIGYRISDGAQVYDSGTFGGFDPDGTGVIYGGAFSGRIIANGVTGGLFLLNPADSSSLKIADWTGGSSGDFTSSDPATGTLFVAYQDVTYRLGLQGATIGGNQVPEPATLGLFGLALVGAMVARRRKTA